HAVDHRAPARRVERDGGRAEQHVQPVVFVHPHRPPHHPDGEHGSPRGGPRPRPPPPDPQPCRRPPPPARPPPPPPPARPPGAGRQRSSPRAPCSTATS